MLVSNPLKLINQLANGLSTLGLAPPRLDAERLLRNGAGNGCDTADEADLAQALRKLTDACSSEANLTPVGHLATHRQFVELLDNRARVEHARRENPGIADESIDAPLFITGLPRTGSTLLHTLIAQDTDVRVPSTWEVMRVPISRDNAKDSIRYCEKRLRWLHRLAPRFRAIHPMASHWPQECIAITAHVFSSIVFHTTKHVPSYQNWLEQSGQVAGYRFHRRFLQHLQHYGDDGRWVLKAPGHMFGMRGLLEVYPDAVIVQTHRDPLRVAASLASHTTVLRSAFSDAVDSRKVASDWLERWWRANDRMMDVRAEHPGVFVDVYYEDLMRDPIAEIERIFAHQGRILSEDSRRRMQAFLDANPKGKHGVHRYSLEQFGLESGEVRQRVERYQSRFEIAEEPLRH